MIAWWKRRREAKRAWLAEVLNCKDPSHADLPGECHVLLHPHVGEPIIIRLSAAFTGAPR